MPKTRPKTKVKSPLRLDPTRTSLLRRQFVADMGRRFARLRAQVWQVVAKDDALGLQKRVPPTILYDPNQPRVPAGQPGGGEWTDSGMDPKGLPNGGSGGYVTKPTHNNLLTNAPKPGKKAYEFKTLDEKLKFFNAWFKQQVDDDVLEVSRTTRPWLAKYVESAYKKGAIRAYMDSHQPELGKSMDFFLGTKEQFLRMAFDTPEATAKIRLLGTRAFEELKGIDATMSQQISRVLADGLSKGAGPYEMARTMSNTITGIERKRANVLARTEVIHAHGEGQLDAFEELGVEEVGVLAEWSTAGDDLVCDQCEELEGAVMTVEEARGLIPRHPNCFISPKVPVFTADGWKPIGKVKVGDFVYTHKGRFRKVNQVHHNKSQGEVDVIRLYVRLSGSVVGVSLTTDHPVLCEERWLPARELKVGSVIGWLLSGISSTSVGCVQVVGIRREKRQGIRLYNLSVEEDESYIAKGCVVHNCRCTFIPANVGEKAKGRAITGKAVTKRVNASIQAERPKASLAAAKQGSTWMGKTKRHTTPTTLAETVNFDPDQPRDEQGQWTSGGFAFHGTTEKKLKQILKEGIKPGKARVYHKSYYQGSRSKSVFVMKGDMKRMPSDIDGFNSDPAMLDAITYAQNAMEKFGGNGTILVIRVPKGVKFEKDLIPQSELTGAKRSYFLKGNIPPEWVVGTRRVPEVWSPRYPHVKPTGNEEGGDEQFYYVVLLLENDEEITTVNFDPSQPRVPAGDPEGGEWSPTGGIAQRNGLVPLSGERKTMDGRPIPPAWKHVYVSKDTKSPIQAVGVDEKGRTIRMYSKEFIKEQGDAKYKRIQNLMHDRDALFLRAKMDVKSKDPDTREAASVLRLIQETGIRPGSTQDTRAAVRAYGATTLEGRHVTIVKGEVHLQFVGKKGQGLDIPVKDGIIARDLLARRQESGRDGKLFDVSASNLRKYVERTTDGKYTPKDFRTLKATELATQIVSDMRRTETEREYRRAVREVATVVSRQLGNTPTVALQSYINPRVFRAIRPTSYKSKSA